MSDLSPGDLEATAALDAAVAAAQSGDEAAARFLYRTLQPKILNYLRSMVGDADAEDVASETWSRIARDLRRFRGDGKGFKAWAVTIARHRAIDHMRRRAPVTPLSPEDIPHQMAREDPAHDAITAINTTAALAIIAELPPDQAPSHPATRSPRHGCAQRGEVARQTARRGAHGDLPRVA